MEAATAAETFTSKQNGGSSYCPINMNNNNGNNNNNTNSNCFDDDEEEDYGPETDVDHIDDGPVKSIFDVSSDSSAMKQTLGQLQSDLLDGKTTTNNIEDSTPSSETDKKKGGNNVDGSVSEDSDEEDWKYIRGNNQETSNPLKSLDGGELCNEDDMEYHLNPDAAEFVPTSPVTGRANNSLENHSPPANLKSTHDRFLIDDIIASSPTKGKEKSLDDVDVPSEDEFDREVSKRPSDIMPTFDTTHPEADISAITNNSDPTNETLLGMSTKAVFGDESGYSDNLSTTSKDFLGDLKTEDFNQQKKVENEDGKFNDLLSPVKSASSDDLHDAADKDNENEKSCNFSFNDSNVTYGRGSTDYNVANIVPEFNSLLEADSSKIYNTSFTQNVHSTNDIDYQTSLFTDNVPSHSIDYSNGEPVMKSNSKSPSPADGMFGGNIDSKYEEFQDKNIKNEKNLEIGKKSSDNNLISVDNITSSKHDEIDFHKEDKNVSKYLECEGMSPTIKDKNQFDSFGFGINTDSSYTIEQSLAEQNVHPEVIFEKKEFIGSNTNPFDDITSSKTEASGNSDNVETEHLGDTKTKATDIVEPIEGERDLVSPQKYNGADRRTNFKNMPDSTEQICTSFDAESPYKHDCSRTRIETHPVTMEHFNDLQPTFDDFSATSIKPDESEHISNDGAVCRANFKNMPDSVEQLCTSFDAESPYKHDCSRTHIETHPVIAEHFNDLQPTFDDFSATSVKPDESQHVTNDKAVCRANFKNMPDSTEQICTSFDAESPYKHDCSRTHIETHPVISEHFSGLQPRSDDFGTVNPVSDIESQMIGCTSYGNVEQSSQFESMFYNDLPESDKLKSELEIKEKDALYSTYNSSVTNDQTTNSDDILDKSFIESFGINNETTVPSHIEDNSIPTFDNETPKTSTPSPTSVPVENEVKSDTNSSVRIAAAAGVATVAATGVVLAAQASSNKASTKPAVKKAESDKLKSPAKMAKSSTPVPPKIVAKSPKTSTLANKKPIPSSTSAALPKVSTKPPSTASSRTATTKPTTTKPPTPLSSPRPKTADAAKSHAPLKARSTSAATEKSKPLANGDVPKLMSKPGVGSTKRPLSSAPGKVAASKLTATAPSTTTNIPPKPAVNMATRVSLAPKQSATSKTEVPAKQRPVSATSLTKKTMTTVTAAKESDKKPGVKKLPSKPSASRPSTNKTDVKNVVKKTAGSATAVAIRKPGALLNQSKDGEIKHNGDTPQNVQISAEK